MSIILTVGGAWHKVVLDESNFNVYNVNGDCGLNFLSIADEADWANKRGTKSSENQWFSVTAPSNNEGVSPACRVASPKKVTGPAA